MLEGFLQILVTSSCLHFALKYKVQHLWLLLFSQKVDRWRQASENPKILLLSSWPPPRAAQWLDRSHHSYEGERNVFVPTCYTQQCRESALLFSPTKYASVQQSSVQQGSVQHSRVWPSGRAEFIWKSAEEGLIHASRPTHTRTLGCTICWWTILYLIALCLAVSNTVVTTAAALDVSLVKCIALASIYEGVCLA